jgi:hypothetical protein
MKLGSGPHRKLGGCPQLTHRVHICQGFMRTGGVMPPQSMKPLGRVPESPRIVISEPGFAIPQRTAMLLRD